MKYTNDQVRFILRCIELDLSYNEFESLRSLVPGFPEVPLATYSNNIGYLRAGMPVEEIVARRPSWTEVKEYAAAHRYGKGE